MTPCACLEDGVVRTTQKETSRSNQNSISSTKLLGGYPSSISILLDFINVPFTVLLVSLFHNHRCPIMSLVNVLKQILDYLDTPTCLDIDVAVEQMEKIRVVRHNPSVVKLMSTNFLFLAIFTPSINWI
jgi:hypothetical protein